MIKLLTIFIIIKCLFAEGPPLLFSGNDQPKPGLGINSGIIDYGMSQWVFTNKFKHAREWRPCTSNTNWKNYTWTGQFNTTWSSDGYPLTFINHPYGSTYVGYQTEFGTNGNYQTGEYVATFEGTGNITFLGDATDLKYTGNNRFEFYVNKTTTTGIVLIITAPNAININVRLREDEFLNETFDKNYTQAIKIFEALRFSDWMINREGNSVPNPNQEWATRRPVTYYTQHGRNMVSIEYILELVNTLEKDVWLSIPSAASTDYITKMAEYVRDNINNQTKSIYVEQSSGKGFNGNNKTLQMNLVRTWKQVFGNDTRVKYILSTWQYGYFENTMSFYTDQELKEFHAYSVAGNIAYGVPFNFDNFNLTDSQNYTVDTIIDIIRQQIYNDESAVIYNVQKTRVKLNLPVIGYDVGFLVHAPGFASRWNKRNDSNLEQRLEDLIIDALREPIVEDLLLDFYERWWKAGASTMFLSNIVRKVERCVNGGGRCGYQSLLENLNQSPMDVPNYRAAVNWLNGRRSRLPFTSDDIPKPEKINCTDCKWGVCFQGNCSCFDGYTGPNCDIYDKKFLDCSPNGTEYGVNLGGIPDWSTEQTFVDLQRRARKWIVHKTVFGTAWAELNQSDVHLSDDGYPLFLEINKKVGTFLTRDLNARFPNGDYVCLYDGDGFLEFWFNDVKITRREAGRIEMTVSHKTEMNNGIYYNILRTNPSNPIRNIRLMEARYEQTYEAFPYHPTFLEFMRKFKTIRFMPWSNVFDDVDVDWPNRTQNSFYTFTLRTGVSIEQQVHLCNVLGANPWFNLPHRATDEYIKKWATYVRDNLRPDVTIYIEVGNECWGSGGAHACGNYAQTQGYALNYTIKSMNNYYTKELQARICYHARTGHYYKNLILEVFNETNQDTGRIKLVIGSQAAWSGPIEVFFLCNGDFYKSYDVVAIAPYWSASMKYDNGSLVSVEEFFSRVVYEGIQDAVRITKIVGSIVNNKTEGRMKFAFYEAGPDFSSLTETSNTALTELSIKVHRDPRIYDGLRMYLGNVTQIPNLKLDVYNHFYTAGVYSKYGCWGLIESSDMDWNESPKYKAYLDHIDSEQICQWKEKDYNCVSNCTSKGVCTPNPLTNKKEICACSFGAEGEFCEKFNYIKSERCTYLCSGHGKCEFNHTESFYMVYTCHCDVGYYGYGCEIFDCPNDCNYNGKCVDNDTCSCFRGFKGKYCNIDCGCNKHGVCALDSNQCICDRGYSFVNNTCQLDCTVDSNRTECLRCPDCGNGTCIRGSCQCWTGYTQDIRKSCMIKTRSQNDGSKIGINLNGIVDWSPQWAFVDIVKQGREWIIQHMDKLNTLYLWSLSESFNLTTDRYPSLIPYQRKFVTLLLRDVFGKWPNSIYHVEYDGEGLIDFSFDAKIIEHVEKNKMKISVNLTSIRDNGVLLKVVKINPLNPIRNLRVVMDGFQDTHMQIPFHPLFLDRLRDFKTIRFMPWTDETNVTKWSDRITPFTYSQGNGVALEYQILLCNLLKTNPWFIVPYGADDGYITEMAKLVLKDLRKDVTIYVEYTNEAWNDFFNSGKYCIEQGLKLGLSTDKVIARNLFYSKRSKEIIEIWKTIFGAEKDRVVLVLGSFSLMPIMSTRILEYQNAYLSHSRIMLAITGYIGCGSPTSAYVAQTDLSVLFQMCDADLINMKNITLKHLDIARRHNVTLGFYESGSGLSELEAIFSGYETPGATDKYIAWNRDPRMYKVYTDYYNMFDEFNLTENCHYAYVGIASKYGPWYLLENQNESISVAHRYRAILDIINNTRANLSRIEQVTCNGKPYNASDVCNGLGFCINKDVCEPFKRPNRTSPIRISILSGSALRDNFFVSTDLWTSDLPLQYAFGLDHPEFGPTRLTDYISVPNAVTFLPFLDALYRLVIFVKDTKENIYLDFSNESVNITRFLGDFSNFTLYIKNFTLLQNSIVLFDKSFNSSQLANQVLGSIEINENNLDDTLNNLEYLSSKFDKLDSARDKIADKFDKYFTNMQNNIQNGTFNQISTAQTTNFLNVLSNLYQADAPTQAEKLIFNFAKILTNMDNLESSTSITGLSKSSFNTKNFNMTVLNVDLSQVNGVVNYTNVKVNVVEIFSNKAGGSKTKVALVDYPKDTTIPMVAKQIDIKFFVNGSTIGVQNLTNPIILDFEVDDNTTSILSTKSDKYQLVCKYYDEINNIWSSSGCNLSSMDLATKQVSCSCTHATKFSVLMEEKSSISVDSISTKNSANSLFKKPVFEFILLFIIFNFRFF